VPGAGHGSCGDWHRQRRCASPALPVVCAFPHLSAPRIAAAASALRRCQRTSHRVTSPVPWFAPRSHTPQHGARRRAGRDGLQAATPAPITSKPEGRSCPRAGVGEHGEEPSADCWPHQHALYPRSPRDDRAPLDGTGDAGTNSIAKLVCPLLSASLGVGLYACM